MPTRDGGRHDAVSIADTEPGDTLIEMKNLGDPSGMIVTNASAEEIH